MNLDNWIKTGKYFKFQEKYRIFYKEDGEGEVLLCIHGFPTCSWDWHRIWPYLIEKFRVIAIDMIGFGYSDKSKKYDYAIANQADLHELLLKNMNI